jgi:hypothetical protein
MGTPAIIRLSEPERGVRLSRREFDEFDRMMRENLTPGSTTERGAVERQNAGSLRRARVSPPPFGR